MLYSTPAQLSDLRIAHDNNGHHAHADCARLLRRCNARPAVAQWVCHTFKCEACEANKQPRARRPAAVPKAYRVNHAVGMGLVDVQYIRGERANWLNAIDWGSSFQLVGPA